MADMSRSCRFASSLMRSVLVVVAYLQFLFVTTQLLLVMNITSCHSSVLVVGSIADDIVIGEQQEQHEPEEDAHPPPHPPITYIYDDYYDDDVTTPHQFRDCVDLRPYCSKIGHRCDDSIDDDRDTDGTTNDNDSTRTTTTVTGIANHNRDRSLSSSQLWMHAHCPKTCHVCATQQLITNVPYAQSIIATSAAPSSSSSSNGVFHQWPHDLDTSAIRDAMGGFPMGVPQYLMSTTMRLQHGVTIQQRNHMIQYIQQMRQYYHDFILHNKSNKTRNDNSTGVSLCQNTSPYCTYWAVVFRRCQDSFYDQVMLQHCPVACQRCDDRTTPNNSTTVRKTVVPFDPTVRITTTTMTVSIGKNSKVQPNQVEHDDNDNESQATNDSTECAYDTETMPNIWNPGDLHGPTY
jgi:ShK domain-like